MYVNSKLKIKNLFPSLDRGSGHEVTSDSDKVKILNSFFSIASVLLKRMFTPCIPAIDQQYFVIPLTDFEVSTDKVL